MCDFAHSSLAIGFRGLPRAEAQNLVTIRILRIRFGKRDTGRGDWRSYSYQPIYGPFQSQLNPDESLVGVASPRRSCAPHANARTRRPPARSETARARPRPGALLLPRDVHRVVARRLEERR